MRIFILCLSALGTLVFGGAFAVSLFKPILVEQAAREVVRIEVQRKVGESIDNLSNSKIAKLGQKALQNTDLETQHVQEIIRQELPRQVANVVADMLNADCVCRKRLIASQEQSAQQRLFSLKQVREQLATLIETTYAATSHSLMREFRIFTASNAMAFVLLGVITILRSKATLQLLLPALVLLGAVSITGGIYLFNQDWLHTIVFAQYVGLTYSLYLAGVALLLADVAFNRARICTRLLNLALNTVGAAASAVPC